MTQTEEAPVHPLSGTAISARNFKCFGVKGFTVDTLLPINIFIGRNNSGKSSVIDVLDLCINKGKTFDPSIHGRNTGPLEITINQSLQVGELQRVFDVNVNGGGIPGRNHWEYGQQLVGQSLSRTYGPGWNIVKSVGPDLCGVDTNSGNSFGKEIAESASYPFENTSLVKVAAERDVSPEPRDDKRTIYPSGKGVTNLIRAFITSTDLPRDEVEVQLLRELNQVYVGDTIFTNIICQENESEANWEIFLSEENKGDIRLSESGSSLKSVFIILATLRLAGNLDKRNWQKTVLCLEEPENNLHPALLRRLLDFVASRRSELGFTLLITTHSPVAIDWSTRRADSQVIHIRHDGEEATANIATRYEDNCSILDDLDIRASDILQANGVIWVEGPTDRLYLRSWIETYSNGELKEGTHFTIMYYGGKLLSHLKFSPPKEAEQLISILSINRNSAVVIDSDRHPGSGGKKPRMRLNATKSRIKSEVEDNNGVVWITEGREIENYIPQDILEKIADCVIPNVHPYAKIIELKELSELKGDKIELALRATQKFSPAHINASLDLRQQLEELCIAIRCWNHLGTNA